MLGASTPDPYFVAFISAAAVVLAAVVPAYVAARRQAKSSAASAAMEVIEEARNSLRELAEARGAQVDRLERRIEETERRLDECRQSEMDLRRRITAMGG